MAPKGPLKVMPIELGFYDDARRYPEGHKRFSGAFEIAELADYSPNWMEPVGWEFDEKEWRAAGKAKYDRLQREAPLKAKASKAELRRLMKGEKGVQIPGQAPKPALRPARSIEAADAELDRVLAERGAVLKKPAKGTGDQDVLG